MPGFVDVGLIFFRYRVIGWEEFLSNDLFLYPVEHKIFNHFKKLAEVPCETIFVRFIVGL